MFTAHTANIENSTTTVHFKTRMLVVQGAYTLAMKWKHDIVAHGHINLCIIAHHHALRPRKSTIIDVTAYLTLLEHNANV